VVPAGGGACEVRGWRRRRQRSCGALIRVSLRGTGGGGEGLKGAEDGGKGGGGGVALITDLTTRNVVVPGKDGRRRRCGARALAATGAATAVWRAYLCRCVGPIAQLIRFLLGRHRATQRSGGRPA